jgi:hypothetical protein
MKSSQWFVIMGICYLSSFYFGWLCSSWVGVQAKIGLDVESLTYTYAGLKATIYAAFGIAFFVIGIIASINGWLARKQEK